MRHFLPHFIQENYRHGQSQGALHACTVFVDLSGFTRLTERLLEKGTEGAEELSIALNHIFQPTVALVYKQGGFIPYFAGDSFTAIFPIFPEDEPADLYCRVVAALQKTLQRFAVTGDDGNILSDYNIGIKIGVSAGEVSWGIVGNRRKAYYFRGAPIDGCSQAQLLAGSLEVVCDEAFLRFAAQEKLLADPLSQGFYRLDLLSVKLPAKTGNAVTRKLPKPDKEVLANFLPLEVLASGSVGEFRSVVSVFISFSGVETHDALNHFATAVLEQTLNFGAYFKEIDFGDKGGVLFCLFGAPVAFENNIERALEFIAAVQDDLHNLTSLTGARYRCGITAGVAFAGVIGSPERCQYAAVGARVNLAARLMAQADWTEVIVDENVQKNRNFKFLQRGEGQYKGFGKAIPTYLLTGRNLSGRTSYNGEYIGRQAELRRLLSAAEPLRTGQFAGVAYVFGEAGIGKSRISYEFRRSLRDSMMVSWLTCQSDQILRKPFNPFIYFLKNYFDQSPDNSRERNRELFESNLIELSHDLANSAHPEADAIRREIIRTQSVLAAMVGISYPGTLWDQLDARGRYQNALSAMANLFVAEAILQPAVIELEDAHWYDDMSREFLNQFIRRAPAYPLLFLVSSRYEDDGSQNWLFREQITREIQAPIVEIDLNYLHSEDLKAFAEARLGGPVQAELFDLLLRMTQGNPFYAEQMIEYFQEMNLLENKNGLLKLKNEDIQISDSVKQIMMARIDRLSGLVKETVKAAAVIGREFELPVLSAVMAKQEEFMRKNGNLDLVLKEQIQTAERWQIWNAMNELRYIFRHSLLREAAYDMQLRARLRELHQQIAEAIEKLYPNSEERYVDLAFHFEEAENIKSTNKYLEKAARFAQRNFQNRQALQFYQKLIHNLIEQDKKNKKIVKFQLRKGAIHELVGQWAESEQEYQAALSRAKNMNDWYLIGRGNRRLGQLLMLRGNYQDAKKHLDVAVTCFELAHDQVGIAKTYGNLGNFYFRQGGYDDAKSWFAKAIEINRSIHRDAENAAIVANLGLIFMNQGHYDEGVRWLEEQLAISEHAADKQGLTILYTNLGIIYLEKGSLDSALLCLEKGLALAEELGNKLFTTICIGSIGSVWEKKGDYARAMQNFERDLELCKQLGDKQGTAIACGLIGDLLSITGEFERSNAFQEENLALSRSLNYKKGIAKALNTLGDNWYYLGDLKRSINYYNEAIEYAREMGNKLVLGHSLLEKGAVHLSDQDAPTARLLLEEGRDIALALGNADLTFTANILRAQIIFAEGNRTEARRHLAQMLAMARGPREEASVQFELWQMSEPEQAEQHRLRALEGYRQLYGKMAQHQYALRIRLLENPG